MLVTVLGKSSSDAGRKFGGAGILVPALPWSVPSFFLGGVGVTCLGQPIEKTPREKSYHIRSSTPSI